MAQLLRFPDQARHIELSAESFSDADLRAIFDLLMAGERLERFPERLRAAAVELEAEVAEPASLDEMVTALELAALRVREHGLRRRLEEARAALAREDRGSSLAREVERLTDELQRVMQARERRTVLERASAQGE